MPKPILVIDNYDSFTYNLVDDLAQLTPTEPIVYRNSALQHLNANHFSALVISPGPGLPEDAGFLLPFLKNWPKQKPILGICLGMQALVTLEGGNLQLMQEPKHGIQSEIKVNNQASLFFNLLQNQKVGRYHSWVINSKHLPDEYCITSTEKSGYAMAIQHKYLPISGVQFHPESILTPKGKEMLKNWINLCI